MSFFWSCIVGHEIDFRYETGATIKRLVWLTDLHVDAFGKDQYRSFYQMVAAEDPDIVLVGGDISNGIASLTHLANLAAFINKQFYFVLGNHDFYYGSIAQTRIQAYELTRFNPKVHYLTNDGIVSLTRHTALIGHDGWSDALAGDYMNSEVMLNDYRLIEEFRNLSKVERKQKLHDLGDEAARYLKRQLLKALKTHERVVLLTHVPPFEEAALMDGVACDANWSPHFVGKAAGDALKGVMQHHPKKQLLILCGHCHSTQDIHILPNLRVVTGQSELGMPDIQGLIFVS